MNDDLISRSALKKATENLVAGGAERLKDYYENGSKSEENEWIGGVYDVWELIIEAQTVDIKPFALFSFDKDDLNRIVNEQVIKPIENGELVVKTEKRPTGHWIITNRKYELKDKDNTFVGMYHKCSECGFDEARGGSFCLNCGADMRGKEND